MSLASVSRCITIEYLLYTMTTVTVNLPILSFGTNISSIYLCRQRLQFVVIGLQCALFASFDTLSDCQGGCTSFTCGIFDTSTSESRGNLVSGWYVARIVRRKDRLRNVCKIDNFSCLLPSFATSRLWKPAMTLQCKRKSTRKWQNSEKLGALLWPGFSLYLGRHQCFTILSFSSLLFSSTTCFSFLCLSYVVGVETCGG